MMQPVPRRPEEDRQASDLPIDDGVELTGVARDATTLSDAVAQFERVGYTGSFRTLEGSRVECLACHVTSPAVEMRLDALRRLEGASDPDDMLIIAALTCPSCRNRGTAVLNYGPESTPEDAEVLLALED